MNSSNRYSMVDAYTLEELRREYLSEDTKGRIRLITKVKHGLPFEVARLAAEAPDVGVRQCIAKYGTLDWRDRRIVDHKLVYDHEHPEFNLRQRLQNDPDPFVRACLRENPWFKFAGEKWEDIFKKSTHMERLALVRNESLETDKNFITKLFDSEDQDLGIDLDERRELIFIFVGSGKVLRRYTEEAGLLGYPESWDGLTDHLASKFLANLWELASKWRTDSGVPYLVYSKVPANDETKAKNYQRCNDPELRKTIIAYCSSHEQFKETIELAKKDADQECRKWAANDDHVEYKAEFESDERILMPTITADDQYPEIKSLEQKIILVAKKSLALEQAIEELNKGVRQVNGRVGTLTFIVALVAVVAILASMF